MVQGWRIYTNSMGKIGKTDTGGFFSLNASFKRGVEINLRERERQRAWSVPPRRMVMRHGEGTECERGVFRAKRKRERVSSEGRESMSRGASEPV